MQRKIIAGLVLAVLGMGMVGAVNGKERVQMKTYKGEELSAEQYQITRKEGTEPPFHNAWWDNHARGLYVDILSGEALFSSADKFDSGTGWPSFTRPVAAAAVGETVDTGFGMVRTEVHAVASGAHLGHIFPDGPPQQGGLRYCLNSAALDFIPETEMAARGYGAYLPEIQKK